MLLPFVVGDQKRDSTSHFSSHHHQDREVRNTNHTLMSSFQYCFLYLLLIVVLLLIIFKTLLFQGLLPLPAFVNDQQRDSQTTSHFGSTHLLNHQDRKVRNTKPYFNFFIAILASLDCSSTSDNFQNFVFHKESLMAFLEVMRFSCSAISAATSPFSLFYPQDGNHLQVNNTPNVVNM